MQPNNVISLIKEFTVLDTFTGQKYKVRTTTEQRAKELIIDDKVVMPDSLVVYKRERIAL